VQVRHEAWVDASVPLLAGAVILVGELLHGGHSTGAAPVVLGLAAAAVLWARRRAPGLTLTASVALVAVLFHIDRSAGSVAVVAPAVGLYSLALTRGRRAQLVGAVAAVATVLIADLLHPGRPGVLQTAGHVLLVAVPLLAAEAIRTHRANISLLHERLELAERERERDAERRVEQERLRIARELHDVVAHTLTEINVQAGAAAEAAPPGDQRSVLERIEETSHRAVGELRGILGLLRDPASDRPARSPAPGIEELEDLLARAQATGLDVALQTSGHQPQRLSRAVSLAAYRIVQESLTNARRHAPGEPVRVALTFNASQLALAIENPLPASLNGHDATPGVGIAGMRERAAAIGGSVLAGRMAQAFVVQARLPYRPSA